MTPAGACQLPRARSRRSRAYPVLVAERAGGYPFPQANGCVLQRER